MTMDLGELRKVEREASSRRIVLATLGALLAAVVILVVAILPAEYGLDPLGTGRLLGLSGLANTGPSAVTAEVGGFKTDRVEFTLGPYESLEYKYRIENGASMLYSWRATQPVVYDFHAEPDGAPEGYAESFDKQRRADAHGAYLAPFGGVHGWYWENTGGPRVTITLTTAGFYSDPREYHDGSEYPRELTDP